MRRFLATLALVFAAQFTVRAQSAEDIAEQLTKLIEEMSSAKDPCPYFPRLKNLINKLAASDRDMYDALKPTIDEMNKEPDGGCPGSDSAAPARRTQTAAPKSSVVDVRFVSGNTRPLTDSEAAALNAGLHWAPAFARLSLGGSGYTSLQDDKGQELARIAVQWTRVDSSRNPSRAEFRVKLDNPSSCVFNSSAELKIPSDIGAIVSPVEWNGWVTLKQPDAGRSSEFDSSITWGRDATTLELRPGPAKSMLSQCRVPAAN